MDNGEFLRLSFEERDWEWGKVQIMEQEVIQKCNSVSDSCCGGGELGE
jgi:hypothetical protein